jgi:hypothetical protein
MNRIAAVAYCLALLHLIPSAHADAEDPKSALQTVLSREAVTAFSIARSWKTKDGSTFATGVLSSVAQGVVKLKISPDEQKEISIDELSQADQAIIAELAGTKRPVVYAPIGDAGEVRIRYDWPRVFLLKGGVSYSLGFLNISYREAGSHQSLTGGYIKVGGQATKIAVASSNSSVLEIEQDERPAGTGYTFHFKADGTTHIQVKIGQDSIVLIPIEVVALKVSAGDSIQELIDEYGLPETKETVFASWPESKTQDDIFYKPSARQGTIAAQHWKMKDLAPCVVSIVDNKVHDCGLDDDFTLTATSAEGMEWYEGRYDGITRRKPAPAKSSPEKRSANPRYAPRLWTDKTGKFSVTASFGGCVQGKVILKKEDGDKLYVPLSQLSDADREWVTDGE